MNRPSILEEIAAYKREFVAQSRRQVPLDDMALRARDTAPPLDFAGALREEGIALIAEVKKASPSKGVIRADFDPEKIAEIYAEGGASALSILTDEAYFQGTNGYLTAARRVAALPALRKDFTVDEYQIHEARVLEADAILLIVALMDGGQLADFQGMGEELGMAVLVEVHTAEEMARAVAASARLIGINNRDLNSFETTLETTFDLLERLPADVTTVSESGINTRADVEQLQAAGLDAILVGESLMRSDDIGAKTRELLGE